jgi:hypothetical protein
MMPVLSFIASASTIHHRERLWDYATKIALKNQSISGN